MKIEVVHASKSIENAILDTKDIGENKISVLHSNDDDGFYGYTFEVEGTPEEIKVIKEFCKKITDAPFSKEEL